MSSLSSIFSQVIQDIFTQQPQGYDDLCNARRRSATFYAFSPPPQTITMEECVVEHNYRAVNSDELTLEKGQKVKIISKQISDEGWWKGELKGKVGVFPNNFVKLLPGTVQVEKRKKTPPPRPPPVTKPSPVSTIQPDDESQKSKNRRSVMDMASAFNKISSEEEKKPNIPSQKTKPVKLDIKPKSDDSNNNNSSNKPGKSKSETSLNQDKKEKDEDSVSLDLDEILALPQTQVKLNHPTADRPKAPQKRRPPSQLLTSHSTEENGGADLFKHEHKPDDDDDSDEETKKEEVVTKNPVTLNTDNKRQSALIEEFKKRPPLNKVEKVEEEEKPAKTNKSPDSSPKPVRPSQVAAMRASWMPNNNTNANAKNIHNEAAKSNKNDVSPTKPPTAAKIVSPSSTLKTVPESPTPSVASSSSSTTATPKHTKDKDKSPDSNRLSKFSPRQDLDLESLDSVERIRRLEKLLVRVQLDCENKIKSLEHDLKKEKEAGRKLQNEVDKLKKDFKKSVASP